jgi:hypothetical protein
MGSVAVKAAASVGHQRAELNSVLVTTMASFALGQRDHCRELVGRAQELVRRLGARRFEQTCLITLERLGLAEGHRAEAINLLQQAVALSKELGRSFHGAHILGALATALEGAGAKRRVLSEVLRRSVWESFTLQRIQFVRSIRGPSRR